VARKEKLIAKARRNPKGLRFTEFETLLSHCGWRLDHQTGSHRIWYSPHKFRLPLQPMKDGKAKGYQVKQFLTRHFEEEEIDEAV